VICQLALAIVFLQLPGKVLFLLIPQWTSTSFSVRPKLSRFLASPQTRSAISGEEKSSWQNAPINLTISA
jgi:hypothetical protein